MFEAVLRRLRIGEINSGVCCGDRLSATGEREIRSTNPATGDALPLVRAASAADYERVMARAGEAFRKWRMVPPPARGDVVRQIGAALRAYKADLGLLVTL